VNGDDFEDGKSFRPYASEESNRVPGGNYLGNGAIGEKTYSETSVISLLPISEIPILSFRHRWSAFNGRKLRCTSWRHGQGLS